MSDGEAGPTASLADRVRSLDPERRRLLGLGALAVIIAIVAGVLVAVSGDDKGGDDLSTSGQRTSTTDADAGAGDGTTTTAEETTTSGSPPAPGTSGSATTSRRPSPTAAPPAAAFPKLKLTRVASLSQPLAMATRADDSALYIAEKGGRVRAVRNGSVDPTPVLDVSGRVSTGSEQGLLGIAFAPSQPFLYAHFTDTRGDTQVVEFPFSDGRAAGPGRTVLSAAQPFANHNGGHLVFGPDGKLYIGLGDGGSGGDPHGNGQRLDTVLGKILRIDPTPSGGQSYTVPSDNPFVGRGSARGEIWSYGLRNPWRFSFDRATGEIWIADVGQGSWEEINRGPAGGKGANYGWNKREGAHPFNNGARPEGNVDPIYEYGHNDGSCSVTGGSVYRGDRMPGLRGSYLFGDYCKGRLHALMNGNGSRATDLGLEVRQLASFGEDQSGELYVLSLGGSVSRVDPA